MTYEVGSYLCAMAAIEAIQQEIIEEFALFDDWTDKYEYIIDLGKKLPALDEKHKLPENIIKGCQSTVWLVAEYKDGKLYFHGDSDAIIVRGLVALLIRVLSGHPPKDIFDTELHFIDAIGMTSHLAQTRSNGLLSMVKQMKFYALAYQSK